jgi:hypothetical protein
LLQILKFVEDENYVSSLNLCQLGDDPKINSNDDDDEQYKNKVDDKQLTRRIRARVGAKRSWGQRVNQRGSTE